jgi:WD40 repeat protein
LASHAALDAEVKCGLPTSLPFNSRFIAVGTQMGISLVYDLFGALRQRLGAASYEDVVSFRMMGSITSLDISPNGANEECCAVGDKSGMIVLWDTIRGTVLRSVDDLHPSPFLSVLFYSDLMLISADAGGLINKATFSKNKLTVGQINIGFQCLGTLHYECHQQQFQFQQCPTISIGIVESRTETNLTHCLVVGT